MKFFLTFFLFFSFIFACNTTNFNTAYQDYYKNQQIYIKALLDNNKIKEIAALKQLIKCGKYLSFNIKPYQKKLQTLIGTNLRQVKKIYHNKPISFIKKHAKYINILSYKPLKISNITSYNMFNLKNKKKYLKVIDLNYAITPKRYISKIINKDLTIQIAQFNKNVVRIVYSSYKPIKLNIKQKNNQLIISPILNQTYKNILNKTQKKITPIFIKRKIIVIDPGHGGKDTGGIGLGGREEKVAVLEIAKYVKYYLEKEGYIVYLTRSTDIFRKLSWRTHFANEKHANLFISIHCNIAPHHIIYPHGVETYYLSPTNSQRAIRLARRENEGIRKLNYLDQNVILGFLNRNRIIASYKFGINVEASILSELKKYYTNVVDGGVRPAPFYVLVGTQMPAILIETGFLTNPMEAKRLFNPTYQKRLAKGIAKGVKLYFLLNH